MKISPSLPPTFFDKGFTESTDPFQKRDLAERLTHLFKTLDHGSVSILDGRWGTGKSVFARQWAAHLKNAGVASIYFDAFASDYIEVPFQAVSSAFIRAASEAKKTDTPAYRRFLGNAASAGKKMASTGAKITTKILTLGVIGAAEIDQLADIKEELASSAAEVSEETVKKLLEEQAGAEATFRALKESIGELPELLAPEGQEGDASLVVIIDELDRCRPDFALGVLEVLKHFFRAPRVHFVLVTNRKYLRQSVQSRYGLHDSADEYLQKFYDFIIHFESRYADHRGPDSRIYMQRLLPQMLSEQVSQQEKNDIREYLGAMASAYNLTLRQSESLVTNVALAYMAVRDNEFRPTVTICFLALLKALRPEIYATAKQGNLDYPAFDSFMTEGAWGDRFDIQRIRDIFEYYSNPSINENDERFRGFGQGLFRYHFDSRLTVLPYLANGVVDRFGKVE